MLLIFLVAIAAAREIKTVNTKIRTERTEMVEYDVKYFENAKIGSFKYNRTIRAMNFTATLKVDLEESPKVKVQAHKFASNEYRLFPLYFEPDLCKTIRINYFGVQNIYACGNLSRTCPFKKGTYHVCNWTPDYSKFPPNLVTGRFKMNAGFIYQSKKIMEIDWYIVVGDEP